MAVSPPSKKRDFRAETAGLLMLFADANMQARLTAEMPVDEIPLTLCRLWFDEVYVPSARYFDLPKGDTDTELLRSYLSSFDREEQEALARFHGCLELRLDMLRKSDAALADSELWVNICRDAGNALHFLHLHGE